MERETSSASSTQKHRLRNKLRTVLGKRSTLTEHRSMTADIDPDLLRAVNLDVVMSACGTHWSPRIGDWNLSRKVSHIDEFISHDWHTSRCEKFVTLCVAYNWRVAMLASVIVGSMSGALEMSLASEARYQIQVEQRDYPIPMLLGCRLVCLVTFVFFLMYWQRMRRLVWRPRTVFLDKLCINQSDDEQKQKGILALAGFLKHSRRLHILWSKKYFSRLWCTYEIASWFSLSKETQDVTLSPVDLSMAVLVFCFGAACLIIGAIPLSFVTPFALRAAASGVLQFGLLSLILSQVRPLMRNLRDLPRQFADFSVRHSNCFCCDAQHVHPVTGEVLSCDRQMVYSTLKEWFGSGATCSTLDHLDQFDMQVRASLVHLVVHQADGEVWAYRNALFVGTAFLWEFVARVFAAFSLDTLIYVRYVCEPLVFFFAACPSCMALTFLSVNWEERFLEWGRCSRRRWASCFIFVLVYFVWFVGSVGLLLSRMVLGVWVQVATSAVLMLLTLVLFRASLRRQGQQGVNTGCLLMGQGKSRAFEVTRSADVTWKGNSEAGISEQTAGVQL